MRSASFRLSILVAIMLLFVTASGSMALAQTATGNGSVSDQAKPVLDRAIQFMGGADNIRALKDLETRWQGTMISPQVALEMRSHSIIVYPGIYRYEYKLSLGQKSMSVEAFFDGTNGWRMAEGTLKDMNEDQKKGTRQEMFHSLPNLLGLVGSPTVTYEGQSVGNDVLLFGLGDLSARLHIDSTGQVVKLAYRDKTDELEETFSDYRKVGSVKMAYKGSVTKNGQKLLDGQVIEAKANINPSLEKLAQRPSGSQQSVSLEQGLNSQYPKGTVLNLLTTGVVGTIGCPIHPTSTFKDGKLHAPGFGQNVLLGTTNCATQPIDPGTKVYVAEMKVNQKTNRISFAVIQCTMVGTVANCNGAVSQVDFEFPKGFLATAQLAQVQEAIHRVFSIDYIPKGPAQGGQVAAVSEPVAPPPPPVAPLKLPAAYASAQTPADKLQLNADNSFSLQEGGEPYRGTFAANGNTLELNFSDGTTKAILSRQGNNLSGSDGQTWVLREQYAGATSSGAMLQNGDIIKLVQVGIDDATIIAKIGSSKCQFDTSTDGLIQLKQGGVSAAVLKTMVGAGK